MLPPVAHVINPDYRITMAETRGWIIYEPLVGILVSEWTSPYALFQSALNKSPESGHAIYKKYRDTFNVISHRFYQKHHLARFTKHLVQYMDNKSTKRAYIKIFKDLKLARKLQKEQKRTRKLIKLIQIRKLNRKLEAEIDL